MTRWISCRTGAMKSPRRSTESFGTGARNVVATYEQTRGREAERFGSSACSGGRGWGRRGRGCGGGRRVRGRGPRARRGRGARRRAWRGIGGGLPLDHVQEVLLELGV